MEAHVLIASTKVDVATDVVVRLLTARGVRVTRLNTEDFPFDSRLTTRLFRDSEKQSSNSYRLLNLPEVSLDDTSSIWYRRIRSPEPPAEMLPGVYDFCLKEARSALAGMILAYPGRIMSPPPNIWRAEHKVLQLSVAKAVGLQVPETIVTNDPAEVFGAFSRFRGQMIAKPVRTGFVDYGEEQHAIFTSQVLEEHLHEIEDARWSPVIYQPLIEKKYDVRVTVVGNKIFAAEIDSQSDLGAKIDWRHSSTSDLPHYCTQLPREICEGIRHLLIKLGLSFGAIDLIRTPADQYIFLEINPNGQWLWLDDILDLGISEAVADWLAETFQ